MTPRDPNERFDRSYDDAIGIVSARRRKRRAAIRRKSSRGLIASGFAAVLIVIAVVLVGGSAAAGLAAYSVVDGMNLDDMKANPPGVNSTIYAANGVKLATIPSVENRTPVQAWQISPWLKTATVDIEDRRFYQHGGVDFTGIIRAAMDDLEAGHVVQGASTIEQQVVRNLYLNDDFSATRKLKEAWLARQMADEWSKEKILTTYLNIVPYGGVTYGCEAAAQAYFSTHCKDLGLTQAAMIAGLPQSPTEYNPNIHPQAALTRRNDVLLAMLQNHHISQTQYDTAIQRPLGIKPGGQNFLAKQPYFVQYIEAQMKAKYGKKALHQGGLEVHTTLDPTLQRAAHKALTSIIPDVPHKPAAALVSIDPRTGAIVAFDASTNYKTAKFDIPGSAKRQAGSSFKPFGLMAAMYYDKINPEVQQYSASSPFTYQLCDTGYPSCTWTVNNAESGLSGNPDLHYAMDGSINVVFAQLNIDIGPELTVKMAHRLGIPDNVYLPPVASNILGTGLVSPLNMAGAYATFASGGIRHNPIAITDVQSYNGKYNDPSPASKNPGRRVVPDYYASEMNQILEDNVSCGVGICTGNLARLDDREAAGKTGTVEEHQDAWFCGYTPVLTTCVWMGYPEGDSDAYSMVPALGSTGTYGGGYPTEIWHDYMQQAFSLEPSRYPPDPFTVVEAPSTAWAPWTSQFQLSAPPPTKPDKNKDKNGGGNGGGNGATTGGGGGTTSGGGGGTTTGGGGGGTTTPPTT